MFDVIIIGGGPAGLSAAIYAARACMDTLLIEKQPVGGGQILNSTEVDNYPGIPGVGGFELGQKFMNHAKGLGIRQVSEEVIEIKCRGDVKKVVTDKQEYEAKALIYAAGAGHKKLGAPGEEKFAGMGVSYCATCDGAFFRGKTVAVAGGGDVALEDALFLAKVCSKVYLIHRRDAFRGAKALQKRVKENENIELVMDTVIEEICGDSQVREILVYHKKEEKTEKLAVDGVFIAVGIVPYTDLLQGQVKLADDGFVVAGENCRTSEEGVYAAGDVRAKAFRQVVTAAADGANAVADIEKIMEKG
mgnify:FL=1